MISNLLKKSFGHVIATKKSNCNRVNAQLKNVFIFVTTQPKMTTIIL